MRNEANGSRLTWLGMVSFLALATASAREAGRR